MTRRRPHHATDPSEMRAHDQRSFVVGLVAIVAIAIFGFLTFRGDIPFTQGYRINAVFESSNQLRMGSPVRLAGLSVGEVVGFADGPGDTRIVELEVGHEGRPITADATARIRPRLFFEGGFYVELTPGSPSAPRLADGGTIPLPQTSTPVQLDQILGGLDRPARDSIEALLSRLARVLDGDTPEAIVDAADEFPPLLRDGSQLAEALQGSEPHDVSRLIASASRVSATLASRDNRLAQLVTDLNTATAALAQRDEQLAATIGESDALIRELPPALTAIDQALPAVERFTRTLEPALPLAPQALRDAAALLEQARGLAAPDELPLLIEILRPTIEDLPADVPRLTELFGFLRQVTDCVGQRAVPVLESVVPDGALTTGRPLWQDLAHALVGVAGASSTFDANGGLFRTNGFLGESSVTLNTDGPADETLYANLADTLVGSRPLWLGPGVELPYRPDQVCAEQGPPDLSARTDSAIAVQPAGETAEPRELPPIEQLLRALPGGGS